MEINGAAKGIPMEISIRSNGETTDETDAERSPKRPRNGKDTTGAILETPSPHPNKSYTTSTPTGLSPMSRSVARSILPDGGKRNLRSLPRPPPPSTPPPKPTQLVKILCLGSDSHTRRQWIDSVQQRRPTADSSSSSPAKENNEDLGQAAWSLDYFKKDYSFFSPKTDEERAVRIQFYDLEGKPSENPPGEWELTRNKLNLAVLVLDLGQIVSLVENNTLDQRLEEWRSWVDHFTHSSLPLNLILSGISSSDESLPAATLLRLGAAVAQSSRRARLRQWYLMAGSGDQEEAGLDSTDAILQSLVEQVSSPAVAMSVASKRATPVKSHASREASDSPAMDTETPAPASPTNGPSNRK
jgi:hypothetical protein